ncbi:hypothetical protein NQ317_007477 [Molorchus minor]|uniref:NADH dehydrogenase [ubiquinone] 1 beta subcomplex subunit 4 n=1 Tax=Molorchus minor TaxID=1323400 RepID=A0ABQ9K403_9CUCU|nr:hypothetical protein NQ317_007477 [Molorchus minor]
MNIEQFDAAILRYQAMKVSGFEYFKPSPKNAVFGLVFLVIPMTLYGYLIKNSRDKLEAQYRSGQVAYKDRRFKFV